MGVEKRRADQTSSAFDKADEWAKRIGECWGGVLDSWQRSVAAIIKTGEILRSIHWKFGDDPQKKLNHGEWGYMFTDAVPTPLPFKEDYAATLMDIAGNKVLANPDNCRKLPPHVDPLHELAAAIPEDKLQTLIDEGKVTPQTTAPEARLLAAKLVPETDPKKKSAGKPNALATLEAKLRRAGDEYLRDSPRGAQYLLEQALNTERSARGQKRQQLGEFLSDEAAQERLGLLCDQARDAEPGGRVHNDGKVTGYGSTYPRQWPAGVPRTQAGAERIMLAADHLLDGKVCSDDARSTLIWARGQGPSRDYAEERRAAVSGLLEEIRQAAQGIRDREQERRQKIRAGIERMLAAEGLGVDDYDTLREVIEEFYEDDRDRYEDGDEDERDLDFDDLGSGPAVLPPGVTPPGRRQGGG